MDKLNEEETLKCIEKEICLYPDFPKQGILFRNPDLLDKMLIILCNRLQEHTFDRVLGIESRGFLLGPLIAHRLKLPFYPIRKKGKLPGELHSVSYDLEYGSDTLELQKQAIPPNSRCLIVDDLIATGGSLRAAKNLVDLCDSKVVAFAVIIELKALQGSVALADSPLIALFSY